MADVVPVDFGKEAREAQQKFQRLLGLVQTRETEFLGNPARFFEEASLAIEARTMVIRAARDALRPRLTAMSSDLISEPMDIVRVDAGELARLRACAEIIEKAPFD